MTSGPGRIACPQCGTNNFDTVTACWKCGAALRVAPVAPPPHGTSSHAAGAVVPARAAATTTTALRAALWLGLLFPYIGLPVGLIFLMLDDDRRAEVGRTCVLWSCVSLLLHLLILTVVGVGNREVLFAIMQGARGWMDRSSGVGG